MGTSFVSPTGFKQESFWGGDPVSNMGQNQHGSFPSMPGGGGNLPNFSSGSPTTPLNWGGSPAPPGQIGHFFNQGPGGAIDLGGNMFTAPTLDPAATSQYFNYLLQSMLGPGGGGALQNQLLSFLQGGQSSIPGASQLSQMAQTGNPISSLPEWQAMLAAQQQNISTNENNLKEQFGQAGQLQSSPYGTAVSQYLDQTTKDQNSLLAQMQTGALENAQSRELSAGGALMGQATGMEQFLSSLFSQGALSSPGIFNKTKTSGIGGVLGGIGSLLGGAGQLGTAASDAGGLAALFAL